MQDVSYLGYRLTDAGLAGEQERLAVARGLLEE